MPIFPLDGNGGYDVEHYLLQVRYEPSSDRLSGVATISARATQNLSRFNLDFDGLDISAVAVDGCAASWARADGELTITPERGLPDGTPFQVVVHYAGVPQSFPELGISGFIHTAGGAIVAGEPHSATSWFPANDHPRDRAAYTFEVTVPEGLEVIANGALTSQHTRGGWTTWRWDADDPMATYMAGMSLGNLRIDAYERDGIRYWDGIPAGYFIGIEPPSGERFLVSQQADATYKRLTRVIGVPAEGAELSFTVWRDIEPSWDFFFVEAHTVGEDDWATLPDRGGATSADPPELGRRPRRRQRDERRLHRLVRGHLRARSARAVRRLDLPRGKAAGAHPGAGASTSTQGNRPVRYAARGTARRSGSG